MKLFFLLMLFPLLLQAENYTFSGGKNNFVHKIGAGILSKAYSQAGIIVNPVFLNLQESLNQSNAGITDGEIARISNITHFAPNLVKVPVSILDVHAIAYSKDASILINNWTDLANHKFTIVKGAKFIEIATKNFDKTYAHSYEAALDQLQQGKTELIVIPKVAGIKLIYQKKYHDIKAVSPSLQKLKLYHFIHKKNKHLIPIITPILEKMKTSGELDFIRREHLKNAANNFKS